MFGPIAVFLGARIGARWSHVLAELMDRLGVDSDFRKVLPQLMELVEFRAVEENGQLYHGSGLLQGQAYSRLAGDESCTSVRPLDDSSGFRSVTMQ